MMPTIQRSTWSGAIRPGARKSDGQSNGRLVPTVGTNLLRGRALRSRDSLGVVEDLEAEAC